jgi:hypothetical protein
LEVVFKENLLVVGIFSAAEVVLSCFFVARPLREVGQRFVLELTVDAGLSFLLHDEALARGLRVGGEDVFEQFACLEVAEHCPFASFHFLAFGWHNFLNYSNRN